VAPLLGLPDQHESPRLLDGAQRASQGAGTVLAGLLVVLLVLCWVHGVGGPDDGHGLAHAPCAPLMALMVAAVILPPLNGAGWLLLPVSPASLSVSLRRQDPPPKRLSRS
jgi:hypothetical protein